MVSKKSIFSVCMFAFADLSAPLVSRKLLLIFTVFSHLYNTLSISSSHSSLFVISATLNASMFSSSSIFITVS